MTKVMVMVAIPAERTGRDKSLAGGGDGITPDADIYTPDADRHTLYVDCTEALAAMPKASLHRQTHTRVQRRAAI